MVAEQASYWPELQEDYGAGSASLTTYASLNGKQYSPQEYFSFWSVYEGSTKISDRLWSRNMSGPKYGTDFGYGTDERGVGLTYMYHSLDFDRLRNERTDKPGSIVIDTYRDASGATVYEPVSSKFYDLVPFEAQDYYKGFYETGFTFKNNISISGNNGKGTSVRASFQDTRNKWIVPNMGYNQETASFSVSSKINKIVTVKAKVNYYRKKSDNLPTTGYNNASPVYQLMWNYPSVDISSFYAHILLYKSTPFCRFYCVWNKKCYPKPSGLPQFFRIRG
jgi:hypothetical protein